MRPPPPPPPPPTPRPPPPRRGLAALPLALDRQTAKVDRRAHAWHATRRGVAARVGAPCMHTSCLWTAHTAWGGHALSLGQRQACGDDGSVRALEMGRHGGERGEVDVCSTPPPSLAAV